MDGLLTVQQVAAYLAVSRSTVYNLVRDEGLPFVQLGRAGMRFRVANLERWLEDRVRATDVAPPMRIAVGDGG